MISGATSSPTTPTGFSKEREATPAKDLPRHGFLGRRPGIEGNRGSGSSSGISSFLGVSRSSAGISTESSPGSSGSSPGSSEASPKSLRSSSELSESPIDSVVAPDPKSNDGPPPSLEGDVPNRTPMPKAAWIKANNAPPQAKRSENFTQTYRNKQEQVYRLSKPSEQELAETHQLLARTPEFTRDYSVVIEKVENDVLTKQFQAKMEGLSLKVNNSALTGSWDKEQEQETRKKVHAAIEQNKAPTKYNKVFTLTVFHATREKFLKDILISGLEFLGKTDKGYFGQGIYTTRDPSYAADVYGHGDGILLICQICFRILFPVASCDELMGKPIRPLFDGHAVHVVPATDRPNEVMYISMNPFAKIHKYTEYLVRDSSQVLVIGVMRLTPTGLNLKKVDPSITRKVLKELILKYLMQNPSDDQFVLLNQKLDEFGVSLNLPLNSTEYQLFLLLQRCLGESKPEYQAALGGKIKNLLFKEEFPEGECSADLKLPSDLLKAQEMTQEECARHLAQGETYFQEGKFDKAISEFQRVLSRSPESIPALLGCGNAYLKKECFTEAINHFYAARKAAPKNEEAKSSYINALIKNAVNLAQKNQSEDALRDLNHALRLDPNNRYAYGVSATIYFGKQEFHQAFACCGRALDKDQNSPVALRIRGAVYAENERYAEALVDLTASLKIKPHPFTYVTRARLYLFLDRLQEAENDCTELLKTDPDHVGALSTRAKIRLKKGELALAEVDLKKCFEKEKENLAVLCYLGELYFLKKDSKNALKYLNLYDEVYKRFSQKGLIYEKDKFTFYQVLLTLANTHNILIKSQDSALALYNQAITLCPNNPEGYQLRGLLYQARGEKEKAQLDYNKALELKSKNPTPKK